MNDLPDLLRALQFVAQRHADKRRKGPGGDPYINHLIEVVRLLADVAGVADQDILIASLLHDTLEDTATTKNEIQMSFGTRVLELVDAVTDDKSLPKAERKKQILKHLADAEEAVKLIKLADLCSNVASLPTDWPEQRLHDYLDWTRQAAALCAQVSATLDEEFARRWQKASQSLGT